MEVQIGKKIQFGLGYHVYIDYDVRGHIETREYFIQNTYKSAEILIEKFLTVLHKCQDSGRNYWEKVPELIKFWDTTDGYIWYDEDTPEYKEALEYFGSEEVLTLAQELNFEAEMYTKPTTIENITINFSDGQCWYRVYIK